MMKRIFITYGDANYQESLLRIHKEASSIGLFDEIRLYTPESLPERFQTYIQQYKRGGGYWLWKPWIIHDALDKADEGDIVIYADAGCTLLKHPDWIYYFDLLRDKDGIFFIANGKNKKWCKKEVFTFFQTRNNLWRFANQIQATFLIIRKTKNDDIIQKWYNLATHHPHLFIDVEPENLHKENHNFKEHRHDQSVLTACVCTSKRLKYYSLLPEKLERRYRNGQAVLASRISSTAVRGVNKSTPTTSALTELISRVISNPLCKFTTRLLFLLSNL